MPLPADVAEVARAYGDDTEANAADAVAVVDGGSRRLAGGNAERWRNYVADSGPTLLELQRASIAQSDNYLNDVLDVQGASTAAEAAVVVDEFVDRTDGGGSWLRNLVYAPPAAYRNAIADGVGSSLALERARFVAAAVTLEGVRDMSRSAIATGMFARPSVYGYVRQLRGSSCARCAILAGRHYKVGAFLRHPRCDCRNVPVADSGDLAGWTTSPRAFFRSLGAEQQDAVFGAGAAEAIRAGADMSQVVNAYDGVTTVAGFTTTGTTKRGLAGQRLKGAPRLLPDEILARSERLGLSRDETLAVLKRYGYVI